MNERKYFSKEFRSFIYNISEIDIQYQGNILEKEFLSWKGEEEQVDDVLVIGIELNPLVK